MRYEKKTLAVQWHITDKCQLKCKHCYIGESPNREMPFAQIEKVLLNLQLFADKYNYCYEFYITGGDPLLHNDWPQVFSLLKKNNLRYSIMCNPGSINDETLNLLVDNNINSIQFSIDGLESNHEFLRGEGSFKLLITAIDKLKQKKIKSALMFTLYDYNADDLPRVMKMADAMGIDRFSFDLGISIGSSLENQLDMIGTMRLQKVLSKYIDDKTELKRNGTHTFFEEKCNLLNKIRMSRGQFSCPDSREHMIYDGCQIGLTSFVIDVNGDVLGCRRLSNSVAGNILKTSFEDIWFNSSILKKQRCKISEKEKCKDCETRNWCQGCEAYETAQALHNQSKKEPYCYDSDLLHQCNSLADNANVDVKLEHDYLKNHILLNGILPLVNTEEFKIEYVHLMLNTVKRKQLLENYQVYSVCNNLHQNIAKLLYYFFVQKEKL